MKLYFTILHLVQIEKMNSITIFHTIMCIYVYFWNDNSTNINVIIWFPCNYNNSIADKNFPLLPRATNRHSLLELTISLYDIFPLKSLQMVFYSLFSRSIANIQFAFYIIMTIVFIQSCKSFREKFPAVFCYT